jgi:glycosyltransferase involved in cell wall biosynthesis
MTPLRIVHVTNEPFGSLSANGVQQVVYSLARAQADLGHAVAVFSRDDNAVNVLGPAGADSDAGDPEARLPVLARSTGRLDLPPKGGSHASVRAEGGSHASVRAEGGSHAALARLVSGHLDAPLAERVVAWRPDIVHFHSVLIPHNVAVAARLRRAGIPYCVTVHGALFPAALRRRRLTKALFTWIFDRPYLNGARFIHAVSPHEVEAIRQIGVIRPIVTVPNALPADSNVRASNPDALFVDHPGVKGRVVFMFIGRLDPWQKGLDLLLDAFARVALSDAALVLVGPDARGHRAELEDRAGRLGISSKIVFTGPAFGDDRANLLAAADVFVHPSRWEGLSLSVLTAAAAGKACLITREADPLGALGRGRAAMIVDANVSSIADGLRLSAAIGASQREEMGKRARDVARAHFTWPTIAGKLVDAYRGSS